MKQVNLVPESAQAPAPAAAARQAGLFPTERDSRRTNLFVALCVVLCLAVVAAFSGCAAAPARKPRCGTVGRLPLIADGSSQMEAVEWLELEAENGNKLRFEPCLMICDDGSLRWISAKECK